jgi:hypothetical protein
MGINPRICRKPLDLKASRGAGERWNQHKLGIGEAYNGKMRGLSATLHAKLKWYPEV